MTAIDTRIAARRHTVRENGARQRLRHVVVALLLVLAVGMVAMLLQSPVMALRDIEVTGAKRANVDRVLDRYQVAVGMPTISIRPDALVTEIESDPWVAKAQATVTWPGSLSVVVLEHIPVAWVDIGGTWHRAAGTGAILDESKPAKGAAKLKLNGLSGAPGTELKGKRALAGLEFLSVLPKELRRGSVVTAGGAGTLMARVSGFRVDLGSPSDMTAKAATLQALLLDQELAKGTSISLVSPSRPAITPPKKPKTKPSSGR